ncbi:hypothetical protein N1851_000032 [Merluccius polli]|uniref:P2X purinoreceptor 7 intracellular domain-containing protein n=1 Tax=Merluccius polli TaxID=89951 RepID=A0AA47NE36_MERPO|nr:hypothetical protein N1851_000032 [Merluccius polli]
MATFEGDTDAFEDDEEFVVSSEPYLYEPEYTDEELIEMDAQRAERERAAAAAPAGAAAENRERTSGDWWCQCQKCVQMLTFDECFCCREWDLVIPQIQELELDTSFQDLDVSGSAPRDRAICITQHQDFPSLLNQGVLETFFSVDKIHLKKKTRPDGPNGQLSMLQYRLVAYRIVLEWGLKGNRRVLPSCVVTSIRNKYPSATGQYVGFREAQDALRFF